MKILKIIVIVLLALLIGCADGEDGEDGKDLTPDPTSDTTAVVTNLSGKAEAGPCYLLSDVSAMSMTALFVQSGYVLGTMQQNDGSYLIPGTFAGPFLVYDFDGTCYSEGDGVDVSGVRMKMGQAATATVHNINHATTWQYHLGEKYYRNGTYPDIPTSFTNAKANIYNYLGWETGPNFDSLSITGDTTADAYLLAFEAAVTKGRNGPQQSNYIGEAVNAVYNNDITFRDNLRNTVVNLPIYKIHKNLKAKLVSLGFSVNPAPIYNLPFYPAYYADLMTRTPTSLEAKNMTVTTTCGFDTNDFNQFAHPVNFTSIVGAQYIALKYINGEISIWNLKTCDQGAGIFFCPNNKITDIEELKELLLPSIAGYNGKITTNTLINGSGYFIQQKKASNFAPTFTCRNGSMVPFSYPLASNDNGATWTVLTGADYQRALAYELFN